MSEKAEISRRGSPQKIEIAEPTEELQMLWKRRFWIVPRPLVSIPTRGGGGVNIPVTVGIASVTSAVTGRPASL